MRRKISEIMGERTPAALPPTATVVEAARLMKQRHCGSVLVVERQRLLGIFTERDLVTRVICEEVAPAEVRLETVMTGNPDTVTGRTLVLEALQMMEDGGYRHLPVVEGGRLVGIVSRRDFFGDEKAELERERDYWERVG